MDLARDLSSAEPVGAHHDAVAAAVFDGLHATPKRLPPWMLYDKAGAALFEDITRLPEYYLTRTERSLLATHAADMIEAAAESDDRLTMVELGAGSADKTRLLLKALLDRQTTGTFCPVDVSPELPAVAAELRAELPGLEVVPVSARYPEELGWLRKVPGRRLVLFLGSSIGNYDSADSLALLRGVRRELRTGDALLLGTDLVKPADVLVPAYDDAAGVTAQFNKNVLARINRELGGRFDLEAFSHHVRWNPRESRMELYLRSHHDQIVCIDRLRMRVRFAAGELLHTENSHKFTVPRVGRLVHEAGFDLEETWTDERGWFALHLARV